jgi:hypothetical protein
MDDEPQMADEPDKETRLVLHGPAVRQLPDGRWFMCNWPCHEGETITAAGGGISANRPGIFPGREDLSSLSGKVMVSWHALMSVEEFGAFAAEHCPELNLPPDP